MIGTNDETDFLEWVLSLTLNAVLEKYNHAKIKYVFNFDVKNMILKNSGVLTIYPEYWNHEPPQIRDFRHVKVNLKPVLVNQTSVLERSSPQEHVRKAHKRRVAYGKGSTLRKWVEIPETIVNAS